MHEVTAQPPSIQHACRIGGEIQIDRPILEWMVPVQPKQLIDFK